MNHEDFLSTEPLEKSTTNRKKNADSEPVNWLQMRWSRLEEKDPFVIKYKTNLFLIICLLYTSIQIQIMNQILV